MQLLGVMQHTLISRVHMIVGGQNEHVGPLGCFQDILRWQGIAQQVVYVFLAEHRDCGGCLHPGKAFST